MQNLITQAVKNILYQLGSACDKNSTEYYINLDNQYQFSNTN